MENRITDADLLRIADEIRLQEIAVNARGKREKTRLFKRPITQEMIDEYNRKLRTDFVPAEFEPVLERYEPLEEIPTEEDIKAEREMMGNNAKHLETLQKQLESLIKQRQDIIGKINNAPTLNIKNRFVRELNKFDIELQDLKNEIHDYDDRLNSFQRGIQQIEQKKSINQAEEQRIKQLNKEELRKYQERLNQQNQGRFNVQQMQGESEEDYLARLDEIGRSFDDTERLQQEAELDNLKQFKKNFSEITRDISTIEEVYKSIKNDSFIINKYFPFFKEEVLKRFGFDNKHVSTEDYLDLAHYFVEGMKRKSPKIDYNIQEEGDEEPIEKENIGITIEEIESRTDEMRHPIEGSTKSIGKYETDVVGNELFILKNIETERRLFLRIATHSSLLYSITGDEGSFRPLDFSAKYAENGVNTILNNYMGMGEADIVEIFGSTKKPQIYLALEGMMQKVRRKKIEIPGGKTIWGFGLHAKQQIPKYCVFGKIQLALEKLYYKNILSIRDKRGSNIPSFKNVKVSDEFVKLMMKMCKGEQIRTTDIDKLLSTEKELYDHLMVLSGLHKEQPSHNIGGSIQKIKHRLDLVEGEIEAGNNNPELLKELYDLLMRLGSIGAITLSEAKKHYLEIKKQFF